MEELYFKQRARYEAKVAKLQAEIEELKELEMYKAIIERLDIEEDTIRQMIEEFKMKQQLS